MQKASKITLSGRIGLIATSAAIGSGYMKKSLASCPGAQVFSKACPLLVPLVENGRFMPGDVVAEAVVSEYLQSLKNQNIDTLILGCTHYPLLAA